ncbi:MAG: DegT/DnrJ/EryC1/StrS family aminotransferase, partial [Spirochaetales bacterium]|nr:DegT/DnrJ/EryC1/StrS family aminotransferase [Spirochaetales bacterium]
EFINNLISRGIGISVHYIPLHIMPYYQNKYGYKPQDFPKTLEVYNSIFSLPIYPGLTEEQLEKIVSVVKNTGLRFRRKS